MNKAIICGHLGQAPELHRTQSGRAVCALRLATNERKKDASGQWSNHTEWHTVVAFGKTAENVKKYLSKGSQALVEGRLQTRKWQDKEGKERYSTEIVATSVQFVGGKGGGSSERSFGGDYEYHERSARAIASADSVGFEDDDDIPF